MSETREMPAGLRRAYLMALLPAAALAPLPLLWTGGARPGAILLYEAALIALGLRARRRSPLRLSATVLNVAGLAYFFWLGAELTFLRHSLLRTVTHMLLFTAVAKLGSLKHPGEARMGLLVIFLLTLASASSATHAASLAYLAVMGIMAFRLLGRLAVLADFDEAPPRRVVRAVPTPGLGAAALAGALLIGGPLFYVLPRLQRPYAVAPFRLDTASPGPLSADRVDLESFGAEKRSERVVLRITVPPESRERVLRMREAVFTEYVDGVWTRRMLVGRDRFILPPARVEGPNIARASIEQNLFGSGYLFLPYASDDLVFEERPNVAPLPDGIYQAVGRGVVDYTVMLHAAPERGFGKSAIDPASVPEEIRAYGWKLTGDLREPRAIARRIEEHFARDFVYTLDAPAPQGDPLVHFLLRSRAGHCEYFASAAAMMLAARGVPARLVTGSYGGEMGLFSGAIIVRGGNLHAWVEANLDGRGFSVVDPTPPAGIPPATTRLTIWQRLTNLGREFEFFYDRRILGFDALDQGQFVESMRRFLGDLGEKSQALRAPRVSLRSAGTVIIVLALAAAAGVAVMRLRRRPVVSPATRAYLSLRELLSRRLGKLSAAVAPAEVARLFAGSAPQAAEDARAVVETYCAAVFGGAPLDGKAERDLEDRLARLRRLAS
ncbi:MAG: transglutaminaseTgpA domain-containing protein [Thermoanaerobaculia bacterium]